MSEGGGEGGIWSSGSTMFVEFGGCLNLRFQVRFFVSDLHAPSLHRRPITARGRGPCNTDLVIEPCNVDMQELPGTPKAC